jgi:hypothetical protein
MLDDWSTAAAVYSVPVSRPSGEQRDRLGTLAGLAALVAAAALTGCASGTGTKTVKHAAPAARLRIGQSALLAGARAGERIQVTLLAFAPSISGGANDHPEFNMQYAAAQLRLANVGSVAYAGTPERSVTVISSEGQTSRGAQLSEGPCADRFAREALIAPGGAAQGCVPLQVPVVASAATLRFHTAGASARHIAEWSLARLRGPAHSP